MAHQRTKLRFNHVIVCDDIRREDNGKDILIGVYHDTIEFQKLPATIPLCFYISGVSSGIGVIDFVLKITDKNNEILRQAKGEVKVVKDNALFIMALTGAIVTINDPGIISIYIKQDKSRWKKIKELSAELQKSKN